MGRLFIFITFPILLVQPFLLVKSNLIKFDLKSPPLAWEVMVPVDQWRTEAGQ